MGWKLLFAFSLVSNYVNGQIFEIKAINPNRGIFTSEPIVFQEKKSSSFYAFSVKNEGLPQIENIKLILISEEKIDTLTLKQDMHSEDGVFNIAIIKLDFTSLRIMIENAPESIHLKCNLFIPKSIEETHEFMKMITCECDSFVYVSRTSWGCPQGQGTKDPTFTIPTHLVIHHSATTNLASNYGALVLSIWDFHVNTNGWNDIGYNWLVAPNGTIYQGRGGGNNIQGAHFCGKNPKTMGICMLGDYTTATLTIEAKNSLSKILAWKACQENLKITDTTFHNSSQLNLPVVCGHRDGCATSCPGDNVYNFIPEIRQQSSDILQGCIKLNNSTEEINTFIITPNPVSNFIIVNKSGYLYLYNSQGRLVKTQYIIAQEKIDVSDFISGIYHLIVKNENQINQGILIKL